MRRRTPDTQQLHTRHQDRLVTAATWTVAPAMPTSYLKEFLRQVRRAAGKRKDRVFRGRLRALGQHRRIELDHGSDAVDIAGLDRCRSSPSPHRRDTIRDHHHGLFLHIRPVPIWMGAKPDELHNLNWDRSGASKRSASSTDVNICLASRWIGLFSVR